MSVSKTKHNVRLVGRRDSKAVNNYRKLVASISKAFYQDGHRK